MKNILIKPDSNIKDALKQLRQVGEKCLVVVDNVNKMLGTLRKFSTSAVFASLDFIITSKPLFCNPDLWLDANTSVGWISVLGSKSSNKSPAFANNAFATSPVKWACLPSSTSKVS